MEIIWPITEAKDKKFTANVKEGWGKEGKERFDELLIQEKENRENYSNDVAGDNTERVDRYNYCPLSNDVSGVDADESDLDTNDNGGMMYNWLE